jgi:hypothetical protein
MTETTTADDDRKRKQFSYSELLGAAEICKPLINPETGEWRAEVKLDRIAARLEEQGIVRIVTPANLESLRLAIQQAFFKDAKPPALKPVVGVAQVNQRITEIEARLLARLEQLGTAIDDLQEAVRLLKLGRS